MRIKRTLFFSLILFLIIFSISFASADELTTTDNTNELSELSVSNDISIDENINDAKIDSVENQKANDVKSNSSEELSSSDKDLKDGALNTNEIESDECLEDNNNGKVPTLQANKLGLDINMTGGSAQDVMNNIVRISRSGGGTLYLNGGTYGVVETLPLVQMRL
jgi:FKBP-type peptidyl-prolyl cis-trans isomerase